MARVTQRLVIRQGQKESEVFQGLQGAPQTNLLILPPTILPEIVKLKVSDEAGGEFIDYQIDERDVVFTARKSLHIAALPGVYWRLVSQTKVTEDRTFRVIAHEIG